MIRVGDIVRPRAKDVCECCEGISGIVIDEMEMEDGFFMFEVLIGSEVMWLDSIELELIEKENKKEDE